METQFRVVFKGKILAGFDPATVRVRAEQKLKASSVQVERLFSGRSAVLKKGLSAEQGARYVNELTRIGMEVKLEPMPTLATPVVPEQPDVADVAAVAAVPLASSDMEKTQLADASALTRYLSENPQPELVSSPFPNLNSAEPAPRTPSVDAVLPIPMQEEGVHEVPTIAEDDALDPERTLIANPEALSEYLNSQQRRFSTPDGISEPTFANEANTETPEGFGAAAGNRPPVVSPKANRSTRTGADSFYTPPEPIEAVAVYAAIEPASPFTEQLLLKTGVHPKDKVAEASSLSFVAVTRLRLALLAASIVLLLGLGWWLA